MSEPLENVRMIVYDWYDGPTGGILIRSTTRQSL